MELFDLKFSIYPGYLILLVFFFDCFQPLKFRIYHPDNSHRYSFFEFFLHEIYRYQMRKNKSWSMSQKTWDLDLNFLTWTRVKVGKFILLIKKIPSYTRACTLSRSQVFWDMDRGQAASFYVNFIFFN